MTITAGPAFRHAAEATPASDPGEVLYRRYLVASVSPAARSVGVSGARMAVRGVVRVGGRWLPFRAVESVSPGHGFVRSARVAGCVAVEDVAVPGEVVHRVRVGARTLREEGGEDVVRRAVGELVAATMWAPSALAARPDVRRVATGRSTLHVAVPAEPGSVLPPIPHGGAGITLSLHRHGLPQDVRLVRWGDPSGGQRPDWFPFGGPVHEHRSWAGVTVPATGALGWFPDTERWTEVLRWQLTAWEPLGGRVAA